jgi:hypothetical protein
MVLYQWNLFSTPFSDKPADLERQRYIPSQRTSRTEDIIYGKSTMKTGLERFPRRTLLHIFLKVGWPPKKNRENSTNNFACDFPWFFPNIHKHVFPSFLFHSKKNEFPLQSFPPFVPSFLPHPAPSPFAVLAISPRAKEAVGLCWIS